MSSTLEARIKARAVELGFDLVGITSAEPSAFAAEYRDWIGNGYAGEMEYLARNLERRTDLRQLLPDARSIIVVGMNYYTREIATDEGAIWVRGREVENIPHPQPLSRRREEGWMVTDPELRGRGDGGTGRACGSQVPLPRVPTPREERAMKAGEWERLGEGAKTREEGEALLPTVDCLLPNGEAVFARYARGDDYHDVMAARMRMLLEYMKSEAGPDTEGRVYVDTGPILEREVARRAGLGWFGKNTMLINTRRGSYFFLGEIVTNVPLTPDEPSVGGCGTCTRCLDACPTNAFVAPFVLDSRRCISYLTIELKGAIPEEFIPAIGAAGNRVYGCDICQEVCPFCITRSTPTSEAAFQPRDITINSKLTDLLYLTDEQFREKFKGSPVKRAKRRGLLRSVAAALSTRDDDEAIAALKHALSDHEPLVREQAEWSLKEIERRRSGTNNT